MTACIGNQCRYLWGSRCGCIADAWAEASDWSRGTITEIHDFREPFHSPYALSKAHIQQCWQRYSLFFWPHNPLTEPLSIEEMDAGIAEPLLKSSTRARKTTPNGCSRRRCPIIRSFAQKIEERRALIRQIRLGRTSDTLEQWQVGALDYNQHLASGGITPRFPS
jgi:hypothetical protein